MLEMKTLRDDAVREGEQLKLAKEEIKSLLSEKELVLKEVHHRIKNNMNTIRGLILLQSEMLKDPIAAEALSNASRRIQSMTILYEKLYRSKNLYEVSMKDYLPSLIDEILENLSVEAKLKKTVTGDGKLISLTVKDNGNGLPESVDINNSTGFGLMLVKMLTRQLSGNIQVEQENGTRFILEFAE